MPFAPFGLHWLSFAAALVALGSVTLAAWAVLAFSRRDGHDE